MPDVEMGATVRITINDREPIERVIGPGGDEWRQRAYPLFSERHVLNHWAYNAMANGCVDVCQLDGWADVPAETVIFEVLDVEPVS